MVNKYIFKSLNYSQFQIIKNEKNKNPRDKIRALSIEKFIDKTLFDFNDKINIIRKFATNVPHAAPATPNIGTKIIVNSIFKETPIKDA